MTPSTQTWLVPRGVLLVAVIVTVFGAGLDAPFFFDDIGSISANPHTVTPWSLEAFSAPDQSTAAGRPLVAWSLALNRAAGGLDPRGYHVVNIAFHALNALLLWALVTVLLRAPGRPRWLAERGELLAWLVALLWASHPLQSEAVTYVIQRTELMAASATLGAVLCALLSFAAHRPGRWQAGALACCLAGVLCKETAVAIPLLVVVAHRASFATSWRHALAQAPRLYAGLAACWLPLAALVVSGPRSASVGFSHGITAGEWLMTQAQVLPHYLRLSFWPEPLALVYHWPIVEQFAPAAFPGLLVVALLLGTVLALRRSPLLALPGAWFFLLMAPSSSFVPIWTEVAAERRTYLALAAVIALVVVGVAALLHKGSRGRTRSLIPRALTVLCLGLAALSCAVAQQRVALYSDQVALWTDTVEHQPNSAMAHRQLGRALFQTGRLQEAVASYGQSIVLDPQDSGLRINLGNCLLALGDLDGAVAAYGAALELAPDHAPAHQNMGLALARSGDLEQALSCFREAVALDPGYGDAHANLAALLLGRGAMAEAVEHLEQALVLAPDHPLALSLLGQLQARLGEREAVGS